MHEDANPSNWPPGASETAQLIRSHDWSSSTLGTIDTWPASLKTAVSLCLDSRFPSYIWWGPEQINIYNDAYRELAGPKNHPRYFGKPAREMWSEIWPTLQSFINEVATSGTSILHEDLLLPVQRHGTEEEAYFTFSYGPARDETGQIRGLSCTCFETTEKVKAQRRSDAAVKELQGLFMQSPVPMVILLGPEHRFSIVNPPYEKLTGRTDMLGKTVREVFSREDIGPFVELLDGVYQSGKPYVGHETLLKLINEEGQLIDHWLDFGYHPYRNDDGSVKGVLVIATDVTVQVLAKRAIEKSHQDFQELANYMPQIVWTTRADGSADYFNDVATKYSGIPLIESLGEGWTSWVHPDDLPTTAQAWRKAISSKSTYTNEFRLKRSDGDYRWHLSRAYPVLGRQGEILKWIGTNTDIHEAKTFTSALQLEKQKFETLFADASTSMALLRGPELKFEAVNPSYHKLFNHRVKVGMPILENLPELRGQVFSTLLQKVYSEGVPYRDEEAEAYLRRSDDSPLEERYFTQTYTQVTDAAGLPYGVFIHAIEVTNEVRARRQLETSQRRMKLAVEAAHMGTWHIDLKTSEITSSEEFRRIFESDILSWNLQGTIQKYIHPDDRPRVTETLSASIEEKIPYVHEYRIVTESGKLKWVHSRGQATYDKEGNALTLSGVLMDITDKKIAEERLSRLTTDLQIAVGKRDEFMSIASHELKTPLTSMRLNTQLMKRTQDLRPHEPISPEKVKRLIESTDKQVARLIRLVDDMLDISRIESGKLSIQFETHSLKNIIEDVAVELKEQLENAQCSLSLQLEANAAGLFDRARLEQVITNLLTNATRYGKGKPISVSLHASPDTALLQISDQGMGIDEKDFETIFQRFERIVSANEVSGLGLGLYISKQIVLAHGGRIWVQSKLGAGSQFFVELPLRNPH